MEQSKWYRRLGVALYFLMAVVGVSMLFIIHDDYPDGIWHHIFLHMGTDLIAAFLLFLIIDLIWRWRPWEEEQRDHANFIHETRGLATTTLEGLASHAQQLAALLEKSKIGKCVWGERQIYTSALALAESAVNEIRIIQYFDGPKAPDWFVEELAKILADKRGSSTAVRINAVLVLHKGKLPHDFDGKMKVRHAFYKKYSVEDLISVTIIDSTYPIGLDLFTVDRQHAQIAFRRNPGVKELDVAIVLEEQGALVEALTDWFDKHTAGAGAPYRFTDLR